MRPVRSLLLAAAGVMCLAVGVMAAQDEKVKCPVSGKEATVTDKTKTVSVNGAKKSFCCDNCPKAFAANPEKFISDAGKCPVNKGGAAKVSKESRLVVNNNLHYFCCANCPKAFAADPSKFVKEVVDPVTKKPFALKADSPHAVVGGQHYFFASPESKAEFEKKSAEYVIQYQSRSGPDAAR